MSYKTSYEKKRDRKKALCIVLIIGIVVLLAGYKFFGWGEKFIHPSGGSEIVTDSVIGDSVVHDTIILSNVAYRDSIELEYKEGHHYITVDINGIKLKGLLDSGCSSGISGCGVDYLFLIRHGFIKDKGPAHAIIANGDTIMARDCEAYNVSVGNIKIDILQCTFNDSDNSQLLVGQGILKELGRYVIDYQTNKLYLL